jgi:hypothetical protein
MTKEIAFYIWLQDCIIQSKTTGTPANDYFEVIVKYDEVFGITKSVKDFIPDYE